jgi:hypothetical protein
MVVEVGLRSRIRLPDQPFLPGIIEAKTPGGITLATLADDVIKMAAVPALTAAILQLSMGADVGKRNTLEQFVGKGGDPRFAGRLLYLHPLNNRLQGVTPLGIDHQQE